jgi:hypothetical protein
MARVTPPKHGPGREAGSCGKGGGEWGLRKREVGWIFTLRATWGGTGPLVPLFTPSAADWIHPGIDDGLIEL